VDKRAPQVVVLAGPNGAGKTTAAPVILQQFHHVRTFVNADTIARGLSAYDPESVPVEAGRLMLKRLDELTKARDDFAFESTLSTLAFARRLKEMKAVGYECRLYYVWVTSPELCISRVHARVAKGGHHVPEDVIRRRYVKSVRNLMHLYRGIAKSWEVFDNSFDQPRPVASGGFEMTEVILLPDVWQMLHQVAANHDS